MKSSKSIYTLVLVSNERSYLFKQILVGARKQKVEENSVSRLDLLGKAIAIAAFPVEITKKKESCVEYHDFSEILKIFLIMVQKTFDQSYCKLLFLLISPLMFARVIKAHLLTT